MHGAGAGRKRSWTAVAASTAALAWAVAIELPALRRDGWQAVPGALPGFTFAVAGGIAWRRRPDHRLGRVLVLVGVTWSLGHIGNYSGPLPFTIALATMWAWAIPLVHLVLTFPGHRLNSGLDRALVGVAALDALLVQIAWMVFLGDTPTCPCAELNLLWVADNRTALQVVDKTSIVIGLAVLLAVALRVGHRWWAASVPGRRVLTPILAAGGATVIGLLVVVLSLLLRPGDVALHRRAFQVCALAAATVPCGFLVGLLRARARRARVGELLVELGELPPLDSFEAALRKALGDPLLVAAVWNVDRQAYVTADGHPLERPGDDVASVATYLDRGAEPLAVIVHDRALLDDPGLLAATTAAARLAIENDRLQRRVLGQLAEVRASRTRIVRAGDDARRRIERDLHDGAQQRLVSLQFRLQLLSAHVPTDPFDPARAALDAALAELAGAMSDLRTLASGIHPMLLSQDGLGAALESVALRSPVPAQLSCDLPAERLPELVEVAAYYVVSECVTNAAKHAQGSEVHISAALAGDVLRITVSDDGCGGAQVGRGSGLRGLADRVQALDGTFSVTSLPGTGTTVTVTLPCRATTPSPTSEEVTSSTG